MIMIVAAISELLAGHECVIVPGLGGFITSFAPARIDETSHRFMPPRKSVAFNASLRTNDGILAHYLSGRKNITYSEALTQVNEWSKKALQALANKQALVIEKVGTLSLNTAGNIYFEPELEANYFEASYGLPFFTKQALSVINPLAEEISSTQKVRNNVRHLIPSTLKWAAVLAPLMGFFIWGSMNAPPIGNFVNNQSGILAWSNSTPGKTAVIAEKRATKQPVIFETTSPAEVLGENANNISPSVIPFGEMHVHKIAIKEPSIVSGEIKAISEKHSYYIVAGAFREIRNANNLVMKLQEQGYPASIADTTHRGLFVVSIQSFTDKQEAFRQLKTIRSNGQPEAWVLKSK